MNLKQTLYLLFFQACEGEVEEVFQMHSLLNITKSMKTKVI